MHLSEITAPEGVEFLDDPEETIIATVVVPTEVEEPEEIEEETELVGEEAEGEEAEAAEEGEAPEAPEGEAEGEES
jgi:large subunit ribosomal protein L25